MLSTFDIQKEYESYFGETTILSYVGAISLNKLDNLLLSAEQSLSKITYSRLLKKKIYNILVESLQNIQIYLQKMDYQKSILEAFVLVNQVDNGFRVIIGNYMWKKDASSVKSRIDMVNAFDREELKDLYRGILDIGGKSNDGGAGLGFIDMAKRSSGKLRSSFSTVDTELVFFTLEVEVQN